MNLARKLLPLLAPLSSFIIHNSAFSSPPNILVILSDDLGYGDLSCYGATQIQTPHLDSLARTGTRFTQAYAPASVCTPSRYALLTGQYAWRSATGNRILPGDAPLSIPTNFTTLPALLKNAGYATAVVGKWHLGLGQTAGAQNWNTDIKPGPLELGFSYSFLIPATGDRVPCVFVENHRVANLDPKDPITVRYGKPIDPAAPTGANPQGIPLKLKPQGGHDDSIVNGISRIGFMAGGKSAQWVDEDIPDVLTSKAITFIEKHKDEPFFLYYASHDIHAPRVAHPRFKNSGGAGIRGDVIRQLDWQVGQLLSTLDRLHLTDNTLVLFSSDNGGTLHNGYDDGATDGRDGHQPNGNLRGQKGSLYEGGLRVPLLARWPNHVPANATNPAVISLIDLLPTCAALTHQPLPTTPPQDGTNILPTLTSGVVASATTSPTPDRTLILQPNFGRQLAVRKGDWKYIDPPTGRPRRPNNNNRNNNSPGELYNLSTDPTESTNLASEHPDILRDLKAAIAQARQDR